MSYCITVIVLSHLSLKPTYLEKYIIAYETTNGHSEFSPFLLKTVCTVLCRVRVCCSFTHGSSCESPRHPAVYTLQCSPSPPLAQARLLSWRWLSRVSGAREGATEHTDGGGLPQAASSAEQSIPAQVNFSYSVVFTQVWKNKSGSEAAASTGASHSNSLLTFACFYSNTRYLGDPFLSSVPFILDSFLSGLCVPRDFSQ